jgi:hypothetical protein
MAGMGEVNTDLWDDEDEFFYDVLKRPGEPSEKLKIRSMVGLIPLLVVEVIDDELLNTQKDFAERLRWFLLNQPKIANLVSRWGEKGKDEKHLLSLLRGHRMKRILYRMLDENEFLSEHGIRALSKYHEAHPYMMQLDGMNFSIKYTPGESDIPLFGGNSNWRGPVWMPANFLIIDSLKRFHDYILFFEYFHGDSGLGLGASHQTGWTGLVSHLVLPQ